MNRTSLVPASTLKRSLAYLIDLLILLLPAGFAMGFIANTLFTPSPLVGWLTSGAVVLGALAYTLVLAAQNASTGQTAGKRIIGIRVLRAESLTPTDFADAYARGFSFFCGLLGLGIAPLLTALNNNKKQEFERWPHKTGNTRVIDIKVGKDPIKPQQRFYPSYPEEWVSQHQAPSLTFPPAFPQWSPGYRPPRGTNPTFTPRITRSNHREKARRQRRAENIRALGQTALTLLTVSACLTAILISADALNPSAPEPQDEREVLASTLTEKLPITGYSGHGFTGYESQADWSFPIEADTKVLATTDYTFTFSNRDLTIYSTDTGQQAAQLPLTDTVEVSASTIYEGEPGLYWSIGETAYGWSASQNDDQTFNHKIPDGAHPYAAGRELLFAAKEETEDHYKAWRFTADGFKEMPVPTGFIPGFFTETNLLSYNIAGEIKVTDDKGTEISTYPLTSPHEALPFDTVVAAGHERVVALWSPYPDSSAASTPVTVAFYDSSTGTLLSYIETTRERIDSHPELSWSSNGTTALYAGYLFDVETGRANTDSLGQAVTPISVIGEGALGDSSLGSVYITPQEVRSISGATPLLATAEVAVIRTHSNVLEKYSK